MCRYVGLCRSRSTGPNVATPSASNGRSACCAASQSLIRGSVSSGVVVGKSARVTMRSGSPTATAATHVVPPPSTPAKTGPRRSAPEDGKPSESSASVGSIAADASSTASTTRACRNGENAFVAQGGGRILESHDSNAGSAKSSVGKTTSQQTRFLRSRRRATVRVAIANRRPIRFREHRAGAATRHSERTGRTVADHARVGAAECIVEVVAREKAPLARAQVEVRVRRGLIVPTPVLHTRARSGARHAVRPRWGRSGRPKCVPVTCRFLPSVVPIGGLRGSRACRTSAAPAV